MIHTTKYLTKIMMIGQVLHTKMQRNKQEETKSLKMNFMERGEGMLHLEGTSRI